MSDEIITAAQAEEAAEPTAEEINEYRQIRINKLDELKAAGKDPFQVTKYDVTDHASDARAKFEKVEAICKDEAGDDEDKLAALLEEKRVTVRIAGRLMSKRIMGKASFADVRDKSDRIQVYVRMNDVGKEEFDGFKKWDIGDICGVEGFLFRTKTGEISVHATNIQMLTKSLRPLPEKWHGLKDQDTR